MKFEVVVANPPFSLDKWGSEKAAADPYGRFHRGIPPKSRGDFAFLSHMIETAVAASGRVGVIVPHGILFRGAAEGKIRQALIEENLLEAVISLPTNLFYGTGIPAAILLFNKGKKEAKRGTDILFVDASRGFQEGTNQNKLRPQDIEKIVQTVRQFESEPKYAKRATFEEVKENDFNLNIPRYVDTFEEEAPVDLKKVQQEITRIEDELVGVRKEIGRYLKELNLA
jgi:type I restriction enzyme M protein